MTREDMIRYFTSRGFGVVDNYLGRSWQDDGHFEFEIKRDYHSVKSTYIISKDKSEADLHTERLQFCRGLVDKWYSTFDSSNEHHGKFVLKTNNPYGNFDVQWMQYYLLAKEFEEEEKEKETMIMNAITSTKEMQNEEYIRRDIEATVKLVDERSKLFIKSMLNSEFGSKVQPGNQIKDVIFSPPATIVKWKDGTKTVVKADGEDYDPEKGLAMAISKKVLGNNYSYYNTFKKWLKKAPKTDAK